MSEKRIIPSNLMAWPAIRNLLPDQKLIVYHLWAAAVEDCGCWLVNTAAFSADLSLREPALQDAFDEFEQRGLIALDRGTGELFICSWYRWHSFVGIRRKMLFASFGRVESEYLRERIRIAAARHGVEINENIENQEDTAQTKPNETKLKKPTSPYPPSPKPEEEGKEERLVGDLDELLEAAWWKEKRKGTVIENDEAWERSVRTRIEKGASPQDLQTLVEFRKHRAAAEEQAAALAAARVGPDLSDPANQEAFEIGKQLIERVKK